MKIVLILIAFMLAGCDACNKGTLANPQPAPVAAPTPPQGEYWLPNVVANVVEVDGHRFITFRTTKFQNGVALAVEHSPACPCHGAGSK